MSDIYFLFFIYFICTFSAASVFDSAHHYWDFEQETVAETVDLRTSQVIEIHGQVERTESPAKHGMKVPRNSWVDLKLNTSQHQCLVDPSTCTNGLTVAVMLKNIASLNYQTQHWFGNSFVHQHNARGFSMFYEYNPYKSLRVFVKASDKFCRVWFPWFHHAKWTLVFFQYQNGALSAYIDNMHLGSNRVKCEAASSNQLADNHYTLGRNAYLDVMFDDLAIWYNAGISHAEIWQTYAG